MRICAHDVMSTLSLFLSFPFPLLSLCFLVHPALFAPPPLASGLLLSPLFFFHPLLLLIFHTQKSPKKKKASSKPHLLPGMMMDATAEEEEVVEEEAPSLFPLLELLDPLRPSSRWKDALSLWPLFSRPDRPVCLSLFSSFSLAVRCASEAVFCIGEVRPVLAVLL